MGEAQRTPLHQEKEDDLTKRRSFTEKAGKEQHLSSHWCLESYSVGAQSCPLFVTPWTVARQSPLSMKFSRQEYWRELLFLSPGDLPNPGTEPGLLHYRQILYQLSHQGCLTHQFNRG